LPEWLAQVQALGLQDDRAGDGAALFGLLVDWQHSQWTPPCEGSVRVLLADFAKAFRLALPILSLRSLRLRILDEFGGLSRAFEFMAAGGAPQRVAGDAWSRLARRLWMTSSEAAAMLALFDVSPDGSLSSGTFTRTLTNTETISKVHNIAAQLVQRHGLISKAFEGLPLRSMCEQEDFEVKCVDMLSLTQPDAHVLYTYLCEADQACSSQPAPVQLCDALEELTAVEERCYQRAQAVRFTNHEEHEELPQRSTKSTRRKGKFDSGIAGVSMSASSSLSTEETGVRQKSRKTQPLSLVIGERSPGAAGGPTSPSAKLEPRRLSLRQTALLTGASPLSARSSSAGSGVPRALGWGSPTGFELPSIGSASPRLPRGPSTGSGVGASAATGAGARAASSSDAERARQAREWRLKAAQAEARALPERSQQLVVGNSEAFKKERADDSKAQQTLPKLITRSRFLSNSDEVLE